MVAGCLINTLPHFLFGPGEDALSLTKEFGEQLSNVTSLFTAGMDYLMALEVHGYRFNTLTRFFFFFDTGEDLKKLCIPDADGLACQTSASNTYAFVVLVLASAVSGIAGTLFYTVGVSYMDDNVQKKKAPALISKESPRLNSHVKLFRRLGLPPLMFHSWSSDDSRIQST